MSLHLRLCLCLCMRESMRLCPCLCMCVSVSLCVCLCVCLSICCPSHRCWRCYGDSKNVCRQRRVYGGGGLATLL